jgi:hypothetical protein
MNFKFENRYVPMFLLMAFSFFLISVGYLKNLMTPIMLIPLLLKIFCLIAITGLLILNRDSSLFRFYIFKTQRVTKEIFILTGLIFVFGIWFSFFLKQMMKFLSLVDFSSFEDQKLIEIANHTFVNSFSGLTIVFIVMATIFNEFVFRKCMFSLFVKNAIPYPLLISSLIFVLTYADSNWFTMISFFVISLQSAYVYYKTGSLFFSILLNCSYSFSSLYLIRDFNMDFSLFLNAILFLFGMALIVSLYFLLKDYFEKKSIGIERTEFSKMFSGSVYFGFLFLFLIKLLILLNV